MPRLTKKEKELVLMGEYLRGTLPSNNDGEVGCKFGYIGSKPPFQQIMIFSAFSGGTYSCQIECQHGVRGEPYSESDSHLWGKTKATDENTWRYVPDCKKCLHPARIWKHKDNREKRRQNKTSLFWKVRKWPWSTIMKVATFLLAMIGIRL